MHAFWPGCFKPEYRVGMMTVITSLPKGLSSRIKSHSLSVLIKEARSLSDKIKKYILYAFNDINGF